MASMKDIKRRIQSVKNTQQITKAMEMVAASKLRKAQKNLMASRPFTHKLDEVIARVLVATKGVQSPFLKNPSSEDIGLIVLTGDKGLCGAFNSHMLKSANKFIKNQKNKVKLITIGKKGYNSLKKTNNEIISEYIDIYSEVNYTKAREIASLLIEYYKQNIFGELHIMYTLFVSAIKQKIVTQKLFPLEPIKTDRESSNFEADYIFEPDPETVLNNLLPKYLESQIFIALLESMTSEHASRRLSMGAATDNAKELIRKLTLNYNRARQAAITKELVEITSGVEALK